MWSTQIKIRTDALGTEAKALISRLYLPLNRIITT